MEFKDSWNGICHGILPILNDMEWKIEIPRCSTYGNMVQ